MIFAFSTTSLIFSFFPKKDSFNSIFNLILLEQQNVKIHRMSRHRLPEKFANKILLPNFNCNTSSASISVIRRLFPAKRKKSISWVTNATPSADSCKSISIPSAPIA